MLVSRRGDPDFVKVCDFGIAKAQTSREGAGLTMKGLVCGTPEYMSPEQARGEEVDGRSDLYAVGVILYQLVTGELPFTASSPVGILSKHLAEAPVRPTLRRPGLSLPPLFERAILRALAKDPDERPQTAEEMRRELRDAAAGVSDWHVASQLPAPGASSSRDLPAQPTTPIHIAQLAAVSESRGSGVGTVRDRPGRRSNRGSASGMSVDAVPSTVLAPETVSTRWPRRLGGLALGMLIAGAAATFLWLQRPPWLAGLLPGDRMPEVQPAVMAPREVVQAPPPVAPPPAAASATTAAPGPDDDLPVVHEPPAAPAAAAEARAPEPERNRRTTKRTRRSGPAAVETTAGEIPAGEGSPGYRPEGAAASPEPAPIASAPAREHRSAAPTTAADLHERGRTPAGPGRSGERLQKGRGIEDHDPQAAQHLQVPREVLHARRSTRAGQRSLPPLPGTGARGARRRVHQEHRSMIPAAPRAAPALLALAGIVWLGGCKVDEEAFHHRLYSCNPNAANPACGTDIEDKPMACVPAYQLGGRNFCAAGCDAVNEPAEVPGAGAICLSSGPRTPGARDRGAPAPLQPHRDRVVQPRRAHLPAHRSDRGRGRVHDRQRLRAGQRLPRSRAIEVHGRAGARDLRRKERAEGPDTPIACRPAARSRGRLARPVKSACAT